MNEMVTDIADARSADIVSFGSPTDQDMARINAIAKVTLKPEDVFVTRTVASHDDYDSHYTRMDPETTLPNFVADVKSRSGVPILYGHLKGSGVLPIGRGFTGALVPGAPVGAPKATHYMTLDYYLPRRMQTPQGNTDDIIRSIETGVTTDSSVGFGGTYKYRCDVCGAPDMMRSMECNHWPGMAVVVDGKRTERIATATIVNGRLKELSPVWRGSAAGAEIVGRLEQLLVAGVVSRQDIEELDGMTGQRMTAAIDWPHLQENRRFFMPTEKTGADKGEDKKDGALTGALDALNTPPAPKESDKPEGKETVQTGKPAKTTKTEDPAPAPEHFAAARLESAEIRTPGDLERLLLEAEDGRSYRTELVDLCHRTGVRANGSSYDEDRNARMLANLSTKELREELESRTRLLREVFRKDTGQPDPLRDKAEQQFGGRQSAPADGPLGDRQREADKAPHSGAADVDKLYSA